MRHTPGPWKIEGKNGLFINPLHMEMHWDYLCEDCQRCNATKNYSISVGSQIYNARKLKEAQANARLIAAAPEMLEALKQAHAWIGEAQIDFGIVDNGILDDLFNVINKAGESC